METAKYGDFSHLEVTTSHGDRSVDPTHACHAAAWSRRERARMSVEYTKGVVNSSIKKYGKALEHYTEVTTKYEPIIDALRAKFNDSRSRQGKPRIIPHEAHVLLQRIDAARGRLANRTDALDKARRSLAKAEENFKSADDGFRHEAKLLAEVPAPWRETATVEIFDSSGSVNIYLWGDDQHQPDGHYVLLANGVVDKRLDPVVDQASSH